MYNNKVKMIIKIISLNGIENVRRAALAYTYSQITYTQKRWQLLYMSKLENWEWDLSDISGT